MAKYFALFIPACANVMEEHVMLQVNKDNAAGGHGEYLASMKERILSIAQQKVPADALPFLATIKTTLVDQIMPSIENEKAQHVAFHNTLFAAFASEESAYTTAINGFSGLQTEVLDAKTAHTDCRGLESIDHGQRVTCGGEQVTAQATYDGHEGAVNAFPNICSVDDVFRSDAVANLQAYSGALTNVIASRRALDAKISECGGLQDDLDAQKGLCDADQTVYENKACQLAVGVQTAWEVYDGLYIQAKGAFEAEFAVWEEQSGDRVVQCQTVGTLVCYITALEDHDDAADLTAAVAACDANAACGSEVAFTHDDTPAQHEMIPVPAAPCQGDFEYGDFPAGTSMGSCTECAAVAPDVPDTPEWTRVFHCDEATQTYQFDVEEAEIHRLAANGASSIRICTAGSTEDCVTSKPNTFPIQVLQNQVMVSQHSNGAACQASCVAETWEGSPDRLQRLTSGGGCDVGGWFHSCGNGGALHIKQDYWGVGIHGCRWNFGEAPDHGLEISLLY